VAVELRTGRGVYRLLAVSPLEDSGQQASLTVALERADGVERVVLRFTIRGGLNLPATDEQFVRQLGPWIEREFEQTREAALKTIRAEGKLLEVVFDHSRPGPFVG